MGPLPSECALNPIAVHHTAGFDTRSPGAALVSDARHGIGRRRVGLSQSALPCGRGSVSLELGQSPGRGHLLGLRLGLPIRGSFSGFPFSLNHSFNVSSLR